MMTVRCEVEKRLTRPKGTPGVYVPWCAEKGFVWQRQDEIDVRGTDLNSVACMVKVTAHRLMALHKGDDLEAVKLEGTIEIGGVRVRFDYLLEDDG